MARVKITRVRNSRTHEMLPEGWVIDKVYPAVEFDNTHFKLYDNVGFDLESSLMWPIEDVEIVSDLVPVSLSEQGVSETRRVAHVGPNQQQIAKTKIASTGEATDYYKLPPWATELRHLMQHKNMNFDVGNIFKASYRLGEKAGIDHEYDLMKIIFFAQSELERVRREKNG